MLFGCLTFQSSFTIACTAKPQVDDEDVNFKRLGKGNRSETEDESEREDKAEPVNTATKDQSDLIP